MESIQKQASGMKMLIMMIREEVGDWPDEEIAQINSAVLFGSS
jgi:hypothetical protein